MSATKGPGCKLTVIVARGAMPLFEAALETLGGAVVTEAGDSLDSDSLVPVTVYLTRPPDRAGLTAVLAAAAAAAGVAVPEVSVETLPERDWAAERQGSLPPIRAGRFYVHGSHDNRRPPPGSIPVLIDASAAFGTGRHESTRGCLIALSRLAKRRRFRRPLDLGCGSGVLAIAIAKLWRAPTVAADVDRTALAVARRNIRLNGASTLVRTWPSDGYRRREVSTRAPYDLIVANILAGPLAAMAGDLGRHLRPGGTAVLSGLLASQQRRLLASHRAHGLRLAERLHLGEWVTLILTR